MLNKELSELLGRFVSFNNLAQDDDRNGHLLFYRDTCTKEYMASASGEELFEFYKKLYAFNSLFLNEKNTKDLIINNREEFRSLVCSLLFSDSSNVVKAWDDALNSTIASKIKLGQASLSEILMFSHPKDFALINGATSACISSLGIKTTIDGGASYLSVSAQIKACIDNELHPLCNKIDDFFSFDSFAKFFGNVSASLSCNLLSISSFIQLNMGEPSIKNSETNKAGAEAFNKYKTPRCT